MLLGAMGIATRSKDATRGAPGRTTRNKKLVGRPSLVGFLTVQPRTRIPSRLRGGNNGGDEEVADSNSASESKQQQLPGLSLMGRTPELSNKDISTSNTDAIRWGPSQVGWRPSLLETRTLLGAKGVATRSKDATSNYY